MKDYVHGRKLRSREMLVPLPHTPGEAQVDFGEPLAVTGGVEREAHYLTMDVRQPD